MVRSPNRVLEEFHSVVQPHHTVVEDLTPREVEVLALIAHGHANKEIAQALGISIKTVKTHVGNILSKLHVMDRTQAGHPRNASRAGAQDQQF